MAHPAGTTEPWHFFESLGHPAITRRVDACFTTFPAEAEPAEPHTHDGDELIHVIDGTLPISFENKAILLAVGDSMKFDASRTHANRRRRVLQRCRGRRYGSGSSEGTTVLERSCQNGHRHRLLYTIGLKQDAKLIRAGASNGTAVRRPRQCGRQAGGSVDG